MQICGHAICGVAHLRNLRIFDSGMSPRNCGFYFEYSVSSPLLTRLVYFC
jgi:hypothetical protein